MSDTLIKFVAPGGVGLYSALTVMHWPVLVILIDSQVMLETKPAPSL